MLQLQYNRETGEVYVMCSVPSRFHCHIATATHDMVVLPITRADLPDEGNRSWHFDAVARTLTPHDF